MQQRNISLLDTLPQSVQEEAKRLAAANEKRLLQNSDHIRMRLLQAALQDSTDPTAAMRRELADMRQQHEHWQAQVREERYERQKGRTPTE